MIYWELFVAFLKVGMFSFGGAYGAIPLIRDVVVSKEWLNDDKLTYMIAISESTPGPIMVNMATYVGNAQAGIMGAMVAVFGVVLPSFCTILLIMALLKNLIKNKYFQAILRGLKPCVIGIILATGLHMILLNCIDFQEKIHLDIQALFIMTGLFVVMAVYRNVTQKKLSSIMLILLSALLGIGVCGIV